jgi:muramoyltetrapeptide carboxypeptidase
VAVGNFAGFDGFVDREWSLADVLDDHLTRLRIPVVTGLPIGPGGSSVPVGVPAVLDADAGTLTV